LRNTLIKYKNRKRGEINPIDEKLIRLMKINKETINFFVYNEEVEIPEEEKKEEEVKGTYNCDMINVINAQIKKKRMKKK